MLVSYTVLAALNIAVFTRLSEAPPIHVTKTLAVFLVTCAYAALLFTFREVILSRFLLTLPLLPILMLVLAYKLAVYSMDIRRFSSSGRLMADKAKIVKMIFATVAVMGSILAVNGLYCLCLYI